MQRTNEGRALERTGFTGTRGPQIAEPRTPLRTDGRSPASRATRHRRPRRRSRLRTSTPRSAGCIRTRRRRRAMIGGVCPGTPPETTTSRGRVRSIAAAHWAGAGVRLREAHFQGRAPAVARRVRGHRRIDARPVHRRRPTSGPVVGASFNTAIFRGWSFLATPPQARLELAASVGRDCCCVSAWRHARTTESTSPCHGKCELPCSGMNVAPGIAAATSRPSGYGTVVATVYDRRRLADKWNVGERRAVRRGSTMRLPFLPSPTRAATVRSVPVPRRLHHRGRCH